MRHGFDAFFGFLPHNAGHAYYHDAQHPLHDGFDEVSAQYADIYSTDLFTAKAKKYLMDHQAHDAGRAFFMYLAYTSPHSPQQIPGGPYPPGSGVTGGLQWPLSPTHDTRDSWYYPEYANAMFPTKPGGVPKPWTERMKRYATVIHRMDQCIGDLRQTLKDLKIDENTLIVFTSDNGPSNEGIDPRQFDSWGPFDGFKRDVWEGGVREPTIVNWPGHVPANTRSDQVSGFWDWMPTFADVAGLPGPAQSDGVSLLPTLTQTTGQRDRGFVYQDYDIPAPAKPTGIIAEITARKHMPIRGIQQMLRMGDYVAIRTRVHSADDPLNLYNVMTDPHQDHNLAADPAYAALLSKMSLKLTGIHRPQEDSPRPYDNQLVPAISTNTTAGVVDVEHYQGSWPWVPDFDGLKSTGHDLRTELKAGSLPDQSGLKISGYLNLPKDGVYTFWIVDDGGAQFWIHDAHVIDDDFNHNGGAVSGSMSLKAGLHPFHLFYRHVSGTPVLKVEMQGPGLPRGVIQSKMLAAE